MNNDIRRGVWVAAVLLGCLGLAVSAQGASFDCGKAQTKVEHLICDNPDISKLDDELAHLYGLSLKDTFLTEMLKKRQKQWLSERNKCLDKSCLKTVYGGRIVELVNDVDMPRHWYVQQGIGRPLCVNMAHMANANHSIGSTQNIPWDQVLSINGMSEPKWTMLDPAKYEKLFLMKYKQMTRYASSSQDEQAIPFARWFMPPKKRWISAVNGDKPITEEEALQNYRDFVRRGGKLKLLHLNVGDETGPIIKEIVQYESPEKVTSGWDGYSFFVEPGLEKLEEKESGESLGRGYRVLMYEGNAYSFYGRDKSFDEYLVNQLSGKVEERWRSGHKGDERWYSSEEMEEQQKLGGTGDIGWYDERFFCKINVEIQGGGKK